MNHKIRILDSLYNISFLATVITHGERGIIKDTVSVVGETKNAAREIIQNGKNATREAAEIAPTTAKTVTEVSDKGY
jgi:hypothetical protein